MLYTYVNDATQHLGFTGSMEDMGQRIKMLRESKQLSQTQLAKLLGVTKAAVSHWETGNTQNIKLATVLKLLAVLGVKLDYLIHGPDRRNMGSRPGQGRVRDELDGPEFEPE